MISVTETTTAAAVISNSDLAPVEVEITEAKKKPSNRLIAIKDVRRQGFRDHCDNRPTLTFTIELRRVFCMNSLQARKDYSND